MTDFGETGQCLSCMYPLRGLDQPRCPECGQPFNRYIPNTMHLPERPNFIQLTERAHKRFLHRILLGIFLGAGLLIFFGIHCFGNSTGLKWADSNSGLVFRAFLPSEQGFIKHNFTLEVARKGYARQVRMDDDAYPGQVEFVRYKQWFLVVNDCEVLGAYNYDQDKLYGEGEWNALPFTIRQKAGTVVARKHWSSRGNGPANFPGIPEN